MLKSAKLDERANHTMALTETRVRRPINGDEVLVVMPDVRGELVVAVVKPSELKSYRRLQAAVLNRETRVIGRDAWQAVRARL